MSQVWRDPLCFAASHRALWNWNWMTKLTKYLNEGEWRSPSLNSSEWCSTTHNDNHCLLVMIFLSTVSINGIWFIAFLSYLSRKHWSSYQCVYNQWSGVCSDKSWIILPHIRHVSRDVELCTWVKILLRAGNGWAQALIFHPAMQ